MKRHLELAPPREWGPPDTSPKNWRDFLKIPEFFLPVPDLGAYSTSGPGTANSLTTKAPYKGSDADSEEKHEPVRDIDTAAADSL
jgi:hypothetical protein